MLVSIAAAVLAVHFGRVFAGNVYRACPAFVMSREQLAQMLGKFKPATSTIDEDGVEHTERALDVDKITRLERCRFFAHCLLAN